MSYSNPGALNIVINLRHPVTIQRFSKVHCHFKLVFCKCSCSTVPRLIHYIAPASSFCVERSPRISVGCPNTTAYFKFVFSSLKLKYGFSCSWIWFNLTYLYDRLYRKGLEAEKRAELDKSCTTSIIYGSVFMKCSSILLRLVWQWNKKGF